MKWIHLPSGISKNAKIFMYQRIAKILMMGSAQNVNALLDNRVCFCFQKIVARHRRTCRAPRIFTEDLLFEL